MITCDCGYIAQGDTDDEQVRDAQRHARDEHGIDATVDQILATPRGER